MPSHYLRDITPEQRRLIRRMFHDMGYPDDRGKKGWSIWRIPSTGQTPWHVVMLFRDGVTRKILRAVPITIDGVNVYGTDYKASARDLPVL